LNEKMETLPDRQISVLIVGLPPDEADEYAAKLITCGFAAAVAPNHLQGLSRIEDGAYDLALVNMDSHQLDGCEFCRLVRRREETRDQRYTGLILLSEAIHLQAINDKCFGIDDFLVKPISFTELRWRIVKNCERVDHLTQLKEGAGIRNRAVFGPQGLSSLLQDVIKVTTRLQDAFSVLLFELQGLELAEIGYGASAFSAFEKYFMARIVGLLRSTDQLGKLDKGRYCVLAPHLPTSGLEGMRDRVHRELTKDVFEAFAYLQIELQLSGITVTVEPDSYFSVLETSINRLEEWLLQWSEGKKAVQGLRTAALTADDFHLME
jgi:CheY-like chemotaxis protein